MMRIGISQGLSIAVLSIFILITIYVAIKEGASLETVHMLTTTVAFILMYALDYVELFTIVGIAVIVAMVFTAGLSLALSAVLIRRDS
jgi:hypothetical protein